MIKRFICLCILHVFLTGCISQTIHRFDIIITEILPDPSPSAGLPTSEFIEIKNVSAQIINLQNWRITDGTNNGHINISYQLQPDSILILCAAASANLFNEYGSTLSVSGFPSLNNDEDVLLLLSPDGMIVHAVSYSTDWYDHSLKSQGGWSLEMIDPLNPCGNENWKASIDSKGGTPGKINSVNAINKDEQGPALLRTYTIDELHIVAVFDEAIDSSSGTHPELFRISTNNIVQAQPLAPLFKEVELTLQNKMLPTEIHTLEVRNIVDCAGNSIGMLNKAKAGMPASNVDSAVIINEILFNPIADGYDYVELYNRSGNIVDLSTLQLANKSGNGNLSNNTHLSAVPFLLFPGEYILLTESKKWTGQHYTVKDYSRIMQTTVLPSLPDNSGRIVLMNQQLNTIDELAYDHKWHFALIKEERGVALERIDQHAPTQVSSNWTSAASVAGFGTPGYINSHTAKSTPVNTTIEIDPTTFSPDNDGFDDFAFLHYNMEAAGWVANIIIYDSNGRKVKQLSNNQTLARTGSVRWDGLDEKGIAAGIGNYIIVSELFNLKGKVLKFKNLVVLARR